MADQWDELVHPTANGCTLASLGNWELARYAFLRDGHADLGTRCTTREGRRGLLKECRERGIECAPHIPEEYRQASATYHRTKRQTTDPERLRQAETAMQQATRAMRHDHGYNAQTLRALTGEP